MKDKNKMEEIEGYIDTIMLHGKKYKLRCEIVEVHPIICPKCGGSFELKYGSGKCPYCNTYYTTQFKIIEQKI